MIWRVDKHDPRCSCEMDECMVEITGKLEKWWADHAYTPDDVVVPDLAGLDTSVDLTDLHAILFGKPEADDV